MKQFIRITLAAAAFAVAAPSALAVVMDFEDLPPTGPDSSYFTTPYQFLSFGNLDAATNDWGWNSSLPFPYTPASGVTAVATDPALYPSGLPTDESSKVTSAVDFYLTGAYFAGFPQDINNNPATVQFKLYNDNALVFTSAPLVVDGTAKFLDTFYAAPIDAFSVVGSQGYWVMDDVVATPVPEASTYALMVVGLAGLAAAVRRRRV